ncbi:MAG TPA: ABC transporter substrate-binding protein [Methylomirabilota bacterium]|jgi:putative ABC transport system substrate-binding protein|nr:ABC transporter substrate-binding protein [Methylomirabilota bacterium]
MTIIRPAFAAALALGLLTAPLTADAQPEKIGRIGYLGPTPSTGGLLQAFREGLLELGYIERKNIAIEYRYTALAGDIDERLVRLKPDVLVVSLTVAALAAKNATTTIPIVMVNVDDPVGSGLITSLGRPGGNVTGLSRLTPELVGKNLELLKEAVPKAVRVAVLSNPRNPLHPELVRNAKRAAGSLGVQLRIVEAGAPKELEGAFSTMAGERLSALLALSDGMFYVNRTRIADLALRNRLPSMFGSGDHARAGGLMAYAPRSVDNYRRAATYVDKILKGAKPADLPVEQPTKFELVINLKTAKALGLTIPPSVLLRADEVIQ